MAFALPSAASAGDGSLQFRLEPHGYDGPRGTEPRVQNVVQTILERGPELKAHFEAETLGRRDSSFDIDRAWTELALGHEASAPTLTLGRVHPWDVSRNPEATRPWGYLAQYQPQNRGVLLGSGFSADADFPQPIELGWVGAHFWSDASRRSEFQWGLSATPVFVPSLGSEVTLSETGDISSGRFGRRPPGQVELNGATLPLRYKIDQSRVLQDVVLQPQLAAQATWRPAFAPGLQGWLTVSRAPSPDPAPETSGHLNVTGTGIEAVAEVVPKFPQFWMGSLAHQWKIPGAPWRGWLFNTVLVREDGVWGYEAGAGSDYLSLSLINEVKSNPSLASPSSGSPATATLPATARYSDLLAQAEARYPLWPVTVFGGVKQHLRTNSIWLRSGIRARVAHGVHAETGFDLFGGGDNTYFGEWRTNDRLYVALSWRLGT